MRKTKDDLKPFCSEIQVCPECGKLDVYKDDKHSCLNEKVRRNNIEYLHNN